jgi:hypothetical protein
MQYGEVDQVRFTETSDLMRVFDHRPEHFHIGCSGLTSVGSL